jgi:hypothetical protein
MIMTGGNDKKYPQVSLPSLSTMFFRNLQAQRLCEILTLSHVGNRALKPFPILSVEFIAHDGGEVDRVNWPPRFVGLDALYAL